MGDFFVVVLRILLGDFFLFFSKKKDNLNKYLPREWKNVVEKHHGNHWQPSLMM